MDRLFSQAARRQAEERLGAMVGPVLLRAPRRNAPMRALAEVLAGAAGSDADGEVRLPLEEWEGESLTLLDGWGRESGIHFRDLPSGQEFGALLDAILAVSRGGAVLTPLGRSQAQALPEGSQLWVFVTPN